MGVFEFKGYTVESMNYERNHYFNTVSKKINLDPKLSSEHNIDNNHVTIFLSVVAGSTEDVGIPFKVSCSVKGSFLYNKDEDEKGFGIDTFIVNNSVAILYPYVRAIISNLTAFSNEFPGYNMPTINVAKALKDNRS